MVRLGARSGYEIKQTVELSLRFFWTVSPAQIYPSLEQLERAGLIKGTSERPSGRRRRVFAITRSGETTLRAWLRQDEPMRFELRDIGLVKLFFADALDRDDALALLRMVKRRSEGRVATLRSIEPAALTSEQAGNIYPTLTLRLNSVGDCQFCTVQIPGRAGRSTRPIVTRNASTSLPLSYTRIACSTIETTSACECIRL